MSLATLLNRTVWITTRSDSGAEDIYGSEIPVETVTQTVGEIQQRVTDEKAKQGEIAQSDWVGIFPAGTNLNTASAVTTDGLGEFELVGAPWPARNPRTQALSHVEVALRRIAGSEDGS